MSAEFATKPSLNWMGALLAMTTSLARDLRWQEFSCAFSSAHRVVDVPTFQIPASCEYFPAPRRIKCCFQSTLSDHPLARFEEVFTDQSLS